MLKHIVISTVALLLLAGSALGQPIIGGGILGGNRPGRELVTIPAGKITGDHTAMPIHLAGVLGGDAATRRADYQYRDVYALDASGNALPIYIYPLNEEICAGGKRCWFQGEQVLYDATTGKTYMQSVWHNTPGITEFNHSDGSVTSYDVDDAEADDLDDHNHGGVLIRKSDRKLITAYAIHNDDTFYVRESGESLDSETWSVEDWEATAVQDPADPQQTTDNYSYPSLYQFDDIANDPIRCYYRNYEVYTGDGESGSGATWSYIQSNDVTPLSFAAEQKVLASVYPYNFSYARFRKADEHTMDCWFNDQHPRWCDPDIADDTNDPAKYGAGPRGTYPGKAWNFLGFFYEDLSAGKFYEYVNGVGAQEVTGGPPYAVTDFTPVRTGEEVAESAGRKGWIVDCRRNNAGEPVILEILYKGPTTKPVLIADHAVDFPELTVQDLYRHRWNSTTLAWESEMICTTGPGVEVLFTFYNADSAPYNSQDIEYPGGAVLDPQGNGNVVAVSRAASAANDAIYEIQIYERGADGTWSKTRDVTKDSADQNMRPVYVEGAVKGNECYLTWQACNFYEHYSNNRTSIRMWPCRATVWTKANITGAADTVIDLRYGSRTEQTQASANVFDGDYIWVVLPNTGFHDRPYKVKELVAGYAITLSKTVDSATYARQQRTTWSGGHYWTMLNAQDYAAYIDGDEVLLPGQTEVTVETWINADTSMLDPTETWTYLDGLQAGEASLRGNILNQVGVKNPYVYIQAIAGVTDTLLSHDSNIAVTDSQWQYHAYFWSGLTDTFGYQLDATKSTPASKVADSMQTTALTSRNHYITGNMQGLWGGQMVSGVIRSENWRNAMRTMMTDAAFYTTTP